MRHLTRRHLLLLISLVGLLVVAGAVFLAVPGQNLKTRMAPISVGMSRAEVEQILGRPVLVMRRSEGRGTLLVWTDQLWQVDVYLDANGRTESTGCMPSDSAYRRAVRQLNSLFQ